MAFRYNEIDSNRLNDALRSGDGVELHLSRHRGKVLKSLLDKCPPAGSRADKGTKIMNLLIGVSVSFYAAAFHPKLTSVVSFYVLSKPQYEIADSDNRIFRFSGKK